MEPKYTSKIDFVSDLSSTSKQVATKTFGKLTNNKIQATVSHNYMWSLFGTLCALLSKDTNLIYIERHNEIQMEGCELKNLPNISVEYTNGNETE